MKRLAAVAVMLLTTVAASASAASGRGGLDDEIQAILSGKGFGGVKQGVYIARLDASRPVAVYAKNAGTPLTPASNMKLLTTSAALERLGPDFKFRTLLVTHDNDVILVGDGDPAFGDEELLRPVHWNSTTTFENWAAALKKRGITSVRNVLVDDSVFDTDFFHPNWPAGQAAAAYCAEVAGMALNENLVGFLVKPTSPGALVSYTTVPPARGLSVQNDCKTGAGSFWVNRRANSNEITLEGHAHANFSEPVRVTVHDPPVYAAGVFAEVLGRSGITVSGNVARDRSARAHLNGPGYTAVAALETPLTTVLARCNKDSENVYAESLCKRLGFAVTGQPGSWKNGTAVVAEFLHKCGLTDASYDLEDGCGLSKNDKVSAHALVTVLAHNFYSKNRVVFMNSLAVGGKEGTVERRFRGGLEGRVFVKTGHINRVNTLSGYLKASDGHFYAFSIMFNDIAPGIGNPAQERILTALDKATGR